VSADGIWKTDALIDWGLTALLAQQGCIVPWGIWKSC